MDDPPEVIALQTLLEHNDDPTRAEEARSASIINNFIGSMLEGCADMSEEGIILNPWGQSFLLTKELIKLIIQVDKEGSAL